MAGLSNIASVGLDLALSQQAQRNEDKRLKDERDTTDEIGGARRRAAAGIDEIRARASENRRRNLLDFTSSISGLVSGGGSRRSLLG